MKHVIAAIIVAAVFTGCSANDEKLSAESNVQLDAVNARMQTLEQEIAALRQALADAERTPAIPAAPVPDTNDVVLAKVSDATAIDLTEQVNALVMAKVESIVDQRIAQQVGTADDIEAIFSEVVVEEIEAREEAERLEGEMRQRERVLQSEIREVGRRVDSAGLDEERKEAVVAARTEMREEMDVELSQLKQNGASVEDMMAVAAKSREAYEDELVELMSDDELEAYYKADRYYRHTNRRVESLVESLVLEDVQVQQVADAYTARRMSLTDGHVLMSGGYIEHSAVRDGFESINNTLSTRMKAVLTAEQFTAFEESGGASSMHWGRGRR
ncbi:MAG: outer membrane murein-binding lipoprotein Lpp [Kiritimatiellia bacterium]|jgi:outer membrane murein-binding lipoprotein Lpp